MDGALVDYEGRDLEALSFAQNYYEWIIGIFRPYLGKQVGEVGAGSGNFSSMLLAEHIDSLVAVEPSAQMYPLLAEKFKTNTKVTTRQAFFGNISGEYKEHFDTLVYVNVLEHIEHDEEELQHAFDSLKPGGHLCIFVPALPALYSNLDAISGHYRRYTKKHLRKITERAGFTIVKIKYFDIVGIVAWYIVFTLLDLTMTSGNISLYDKMVVPILRKIESWLPIPVGKNVIMIAQKN